MRVISVQSIAGGTGVTTVASEHIDSLRNDGNRVLAVDLGPNQMLHKKPGCLGMLRIGDASGLINPRRAMGID